MSNNQDEDMLVMERGMNQEEMWQDMVNEAEDVERNAELVEENRLAKQKEAMFASIDNENNLQLNKVRIRRAYWVPNVPKGANIHRYKNQKVPTKRIWKTIHAFASGNVGTYIVDAVDNFSYGIKVGSRFEDLFFSVRITDMYKKTKHSGFDLVTLYFRNPEAYEAMFFLNLPPAVKSAWLEKFKIAEAEYLQLMDQQEQQQKYRKQQQELSPL